MTRAALRDSALRRGALLTFAQLLPLLWLFWSLLRGERVLFLRDLLVAYWPDYVFLERALGERVWPLWNPYTNAGMPFLKAYPGDLLLVWLTGAAGALSLGIVAHLLLGMLGMTFLARDQGVSLPGSWLAGAVYGLSGLMLSLVMLVQLLQAAAWAPWVVAAAVHFARAPSRTRIVLLAALLALQVTTLSAEIVLQTVVLAIVLAWADARLRKRDLLSLGGGAVLVALLSSFALFGVAALMAGTRRAAGFGAQEVLAFSTNGAVLMESLVPRLFGEALWFGERASWAHSYFPWAMPYVVSLYVGPAVLALALRGGSVRLWSLLVAGVLLSLGQHGPFAPLLGAATFLRYPVKLLFLSSFAIALLAGRGLDRLQRARSLAAFSALLPGGVLMIGALLAHFAPDALRAALAALWPPLASEGGRLVCDRIWPEAWLASAALASCAALAAIARLPVLASLLVVLDLLIANGPINVLLPRQDLALGPELGRLVEQARAQGPYRWFSYGISLDAGHQWRPSEETRGLVQLHRLMRQTLTQPTQVIDGLEGAFDVPRIGWEPPGSTLDGPELVPARFASHLAELRLANVRWVLSLEPIEPRAELGELVSEARIPGTSRPLKLYSLREPLPRAFWVAGLESAPESAPAEGRARVDFRRLDPHHVVVDADTPAGFIVVLEGHDDGWRVASGGNAERLWRAYGRYWAVATPGGARRLEFRYEPSWTVWAAAGTALGLVASLAALLVRRSSYGPSGTASTSPRP